jgi:hypothetical protein
MTNPVYPPNRHDHFPSNLAQEMSVFFDIQKEFPEMLFAAWLRASIMPFIYIF